QDAELAEGVQEEVEEAARRAEDAAEASPDMAFTRVYARPLRPIPRAPASATPDLRTPVAPAPPTEGVERNVLETVRHTLHQLMGADERVVVLGEDVGLLGGVFRATEGLQPEYGRRRVIDTPLAESSIVGIAIGMALAGLRPV